MQNAIFAAIIGMERASAAHGGKVQGLVTEAVRDGRTAELIGAAQAFERAYKHDATARNQGLSILRTRIARANVELGQPEHTVVKEAGVWVYQQRKATARKAADDRAPLRKALRLVTEAAQAGDAEVLAALVQALQPPLAKAA